MSGLGILDEAMEQVEAGVKQIKQTPADIAKSAKTQVTNAVKGSGDAGTNEAAQQNAQQNGDHQQATKDFVKDLYAPSNAHNNGNQKQPSQFVQDKIADGMTPEEAAKYEALRKKLHEETYYIPLTQRKPHEQEQKEEEQKEEQEKMQALELEEEKKKKEDPIAVQMGANRAERFPGASG